MEKNVSADFQTYKKNQSFFEINKTTIGENFSFAHVDDINIFNFISIFQDKPIKTFERVDEIEHYLSNQIAGMLYLYLQQLQSVKKDEKVLDSVAELQNIVERMNTMLQAVGKNVIESNSLEDVISSQNKILIEYFVNQFSDNIKFKNEYFDVTIKTTTEAFKISKETIFNIELLDSVKIEKVFNKEWEKINTIKKKFSELLTALDEKIIVETFDYYKIYNSFTKNIYPIISTDKKLEKFFEERMISELGMQISGLPF